MAADRRLATLPAALGALIVTAHLGGVTSAHGQPRLDAAALHACTSMSHLVSELRSRTLPTAQARQRLTLIYDIARTSSTPTLRHIASAHLGQVAFAEDTQLLTMAEHFTAVCR